MAIQKNLNTRVRLKYDTYSAWDSKKDTFKPLSGEMCVVYVPQEDNDKLQEEVLLKVGNGESFFKDLPWISAKAADVAAWAKRSEVTVTGKTEQVVVGDKTVNVSVPQLCFNNGYANGEYKDAITVSLENLFDPKDLTDDLKVLIGNGSIAEVINIVYNAVQAGGTGSVVTVTNNDDANKFNRSLYQGTNAVGTIDFTTADGVVYDKNNKSLKLDLKDIEKLKRSATAIDASETNLANYEIYPVSLDKDSDLAVAIPLEFNSGLYTVSAYSADEDNKINYVVTQGTAGWNAPISGPELEINVGSGLKYTKNDKTLKHDAPGTGSALTPEHTNANTIKALTGVEVDALGHITKITSANIDTTDNNTLYELRTNESDSKGIIELYDEDAMSSDIISVLGDDKVKVSSDSDNNITIEHAAVDVDTSNSDAVSLQHNDTFAVYTTVTADESGHVTAAKKTVFTLPEDRDTITHVVAKPGDPISVTDTPTSDGCNLHYVVGHDSVVKNDVVVNEGQLQHGDEIQVVSEVTYDAFGHTSGVTTMKYTLPVHNIIKEDPDTVEEKSEFVSYISEEKDDNGRNTGNIVYHTEPFISVIKDDVHNALGEVVEEGTKDSVRAPQTKAIVDYVDKAVKSIETEISVATSGAVVIRGTVGSVELDCATESQLPTASKTTVGHAYKVVTDNWLRLEKVLHKADTINHPEFARKGDMLIGYEHLDPDGTTEPYRWMYVPAADENFAIGYSSQGTDGIDYVADTQQINSLVFVSEKDNFLSVKATRRTDLEDKTKTILSVELHHMDARDTKKDNNTAATITNDSTFSVIEKIHDKDGHIVSIDTKEITLEETPAFAEIVAANDNGTAAPKSTVTNIVATTPDSSLTLSSSNKWVVTGVEDSKLYVGHSLSGVTAGTKGSTSGSTFKVPSITVDAAGHVTGLTEGAELTIPTMPEIPETLPNENPLNFITVLPDGNSSTVAYNGESSVIVKSDSADDIRLERSSESSTLVTLDVAKYTASANSGSTTVTEHNASGVASSNTYDGVKLNVVKTTPSGATKNILNTVVAGEKDVVKVEHIAATSTDSPSLIKVSVEDKSIGTEKIADNSVSATHLKAEQTYTGDDAEVWVFCCGSATELV